MHNITLPNILSLSRILCVPFIAFSVINFHEHNNYRYVALAAIVCSALTDIFDGRLARKMNAVTRLGMYLDSMADKLLLICLYILFSCDSLWPEPRFPDWLAMIVVARQVIVAAGAIGITIITGKTHEPTTLGKISTDLQMAAIIGIILGNVIPWVIVVPFLWVTAVFACISTIHYIYIGINCLTFFWRGHWNSTLYLK